MNQDNIRGMAAFGGLFYSKTYILLPMQYNALIPAGINLTMIINPLKVSLYTVTFINFCLMEASLLTTGHLRWSKLLTIKQSYAKESQSP